MATANCYSSDSVFEELALRPELSESGISTAPVATNHRVQENGQKFTVQFEHPLGKPFLAVSFPTVLDEPIEEVRVGDVNASLVDVVVDSHLVEEPANRLPLGVGVLMENDPTSSTICAPFSDVPADEFEPVLHLEREWRLAVLCGVFEEHLGGVFVDHVSVIVVHRERNEVLPDLLLEAGSHRRAPYEVERLCHCLGHPSPEFPKVVLVVDHDVPALNSVDKVERLWRPTGHRFVLGEREPLGLGNVTVFVELEVRRVLVVPAAFFRVEQPVVLGDFKVVCVPREVMQFAEAVLVLVSFRDRFHLALERLRIQSVNVLSFLYFRDVFRATRRQNFRVRAEALQVQHGHVLADARDRVEDGAALVVLGVVLALRGEREVAVEFVQDVHVDGVAGGRRVLQLTAHEGSDLEPEGDDVLLFVQFDTEFDVPEVVLQQALGVVLPEVADITRIPLLPDAEFLLADGVEAVGIEFGELRALVGVEEVEDDPPLDVRALPARAPDLVDAGEAVDGEVVIVVWALQFLHPVEEVGGVEVVEVPARQHVGVRLLDVGNEGVQHRFLLLEDAHVGLEVVLDGVVAVEGFRWVDAGGRVVEPDDVLVVVGVVGGETDDGLLALLGEARAVVDLDVEGVDPGCGRGVGGFHFVVGYLDGAVVRLSGGDADAAGDVLVDEKAVGKEDVGLVVVELVAHLADVAGRLPEDLGQALAADALVGLVVRVGFLPASDAVALAVGVGQRVGRRVEVRLELVDLDVDRLASLGRASEDVDDRELLVTTALDGVVDLRDREGHVVVGVGIAHVFEVDDLRGPAPVARDGRGFGRVLPVVGPLVVAGSEVRESCLCAVGLVLVHAVHPFGTPD